MSDKINVPAVLYVLPTKEELKSLGLSGFETKIYIKIAKKTVMRVRLAESQNWNCCYCGRKMSTKQNSRDQVTIEHVTPRSLGGSDEWENLAAACSSCNTRRGNNEIVFQENGCVTVKGKEFKPVHKSTKPKFKTFEAYKKQAEKHNKRDFKLNDFIQSSDDWLKTIKLSKLEKDKLMNFVSELKLAA